MSLLGDAFGAFINAARFAIIVLSPAPAAGAVLWDIRGLRRGGRVNVDIKNQEARCSNEATMKKDNTKLNQVWGGIAEGYGLITFKRVKLVLSILLSLDCLLSTCSD